MSQESVEKVKAEYSNKVQAARLKAQEAKLMNNLHRLSEADREAVKLIESLSNAVGGDERLGQLFKVYSTIKSSSSY